MTSLNYWKSIQGTRLSDDGQWLAYATSAQSEDGELVIRNVRQRPGIQACARHVARLYARRRFLIFTIAQAKAEEGRAAAAANPGELWKRPPPKHPAPDRLRAGPRGTRRRGGANAADGARHHDAGGRPGENLRRRAASASRKSRPRGSRITRVGGGGAGRGRTRRGAAAGGSAAGGAGPAAPRGGTRAAGTPGGAEPPRARSASDPGAT